MARSGGTLIVAGALTMLVQAAGEVVAPVYAQVGSPATVATTQVDPPGWRRDVYINWNVEVQKFVDAIGIPNTTVHLVEDLNMDLSGLSGLHIAPGVHIVGNRSPTKPGPRLFTNTRPARLFIIGEYLDADNVVISGIRLDGRNMGIGDEDQAPIAISVFSSVNVEIANSEIYGWSGIGIQIIDARGRINLENASAVWIHDNYIHHNRHWRQLGYGVATNSSAYALIERNVFDYNRHALESAGVAGTGYLAYNNLLLQNGGENFDYWVGTQYTHQFDVHGTASDSWGRDAYAGHAGEYFDYRYNTLLYTAGDVLKVRGKPTIGAHVVKNVFTKSDTSSAVSQTEGNNLYSWDNQFGVSPSYLYAFCDFDGDGRRDDFMATGATWWLRSAMRQWSYLNTDTRRIDQLTFYDANGDGRCDVVTDFDPNAANAYFSGGRGPKQELPGTAEVSSIRTDVVWETGTGGNGTVRVWKVADARVQADRTVVAPTRDSRLLGTGDFNADGATDLLWRNPAGQVSISLMNGAGAVIVPLGWRSPIKGTMTLSTRVAGIADFNADRRADILWRHADGQLEIWFAGEMGNRAYPGWHDVAGPVDLSWNVAGLGDFNGDGFSDIAWRHVGGQVSIWYMQGSMFLGDLWTGGADPAGEWTIQGVGDFDADGYSDILWRHAGGALAMWFRGRYEYGQAYPKWQNNPANTAVGWDWQAQGVGDFNADGRADIFWRHNTGVVSIWLMNGGWHAGEWAYWPMDTAWQERGLLPLGLQRLDLH
jgi:hypothetical protein